MQELQWAGTIPMGQRGTLVPRAMYEVRGHDTDYSIDPEFLS